MTVARNLERLRGDTSYADLSRRLKHFGHDIPPLGLRRIEAGKRKVSVDDLVALSIVLDVAPMALMLPFVDTYAAAMEDFVYYLPVPELHERVHEDLTASSVWAWFLAERPIGSIFSRSSSTLFRARSMPSWISGITYGKFGGDSDGVA